MPTLAKDAEQYFRDYVRGGGKQNRKKQVARITEFLDWAESNEKAHALHGLGKRHVINFWKAHRHLSEETAYKYWLGIRQLWVWLDKHDLPPEPRKTIGAEKFVPVIKEQQPSVFFDQLPSAIKFARESLNMSTQKLANTTGLEVSQIESIEIGESLVLPETIQLLIRTLNIHFSIQTSS
jgi:DNA-binding transcriptional regulator YiaG